MRPASHVVSAEDPTALRTAGKTVHLRGFAPAARRTLLDAAGVGGASRSLRSSSPDVTITLDGSREPFDVRGWEPVTRGVWSDGNGSVVLRDTGLSGFDQCYQVSGDGIEVRTRWVPSLVERVAARTLSARFHALRAQLLLHYPAMWAACLDGKAPMHVSVLRIDDAVVMLAGPGGVGKSTLVGREIRSRAVATCDNLAVCDGTMAAGLAEPLRLAGEAGGGRKTTHHRREMMWTNRASELRPDMVVVVRRMTSEAAPGLRPVEPWVARRALVAGTYAAGELRRFWPLVSLLGLATGRGPAIPPVEEVADDFTSRLPCYELRLAPPPGPRLGSLLAGRAGAGIDVEALS